MKYFIIDYDLYEEGQNYKKITSAIKEFNYHKICKSSWIVKSELSATEIFNILKEAIDDNDVLFIFEINKNNYSGTDIKDVKEFIDSKSIFD